uniref:ARAD1D22924p n=1 Tax=Blastobotrys adeninivorans TaxID=409370 RepID=A0A060TAU9_BLAAD
MVKRGAEREDGPSVKRRGGSFNRFSEEMLLTIFSYLDVRELINCHSVCRRWYRISSDNSLWRKLYYSRFGDDDKDYESEKDVTLKWKGRFRIQYNWHCGSGRLQTVQLSTVQKRHETMACCGRVIFRITEGPELVIVDVAGTLLSTVPLRPIMGSLQYDSQAKLITASESNDEYTICVAFSDGSALALQWNGRGGRVGTVHPICTTNRANPITAVTCRWPLVAFMTSNRRVSVIDIESKRQVYSAFGTQIPPTHNASLKIDPSPVAGMAHCLSIVYYKQLLCRDWAICVDEVHLSTNYSSSSTRSASCVGFSAPATTLPTCYEPPYVVTGNPDNTMGCYLVQSTRSNLSIVPHVQLWGHLNGVGQVKVRQSGRAVSVASNGHEILWWDLSKAKAANGIPVKSRQQRSRFSHSQKAGTLLHFDDTFLVRELIRDRSHLLELYGFD